MEIIKDKEFGGERPLFATHDLQLENVTIHAGESALKECSNIVAVNCRFEGKYPYWHNNGFTIKNCFFTEGARAALWYSQNVQMTDTVLPVLIPIAAGYRSGSTEDVPRNGRHKTGKRATSQCLGNPLVLPQCRTQKRTD